MPWPMKCLNGFCHCAIGALLFLVLFNQNEQAFAQASPTSEILRKNLQKWIEEDMYFFRDSRGTAKLFLRRETVRLGLSLGSIPIKEEVSGLVADLSKAAGVAHEQTSTNVNLAVVVDSPINVGDKPNPVLWKRVGLSDEMYRIVSNGTSWGPECGVYSFGNADTGQVGLSIVFADSKIEFPKIRDCVVDGTLRAFGVRSNQKSALRSEDGYYQFVPLVETLGKCERSIGVDRLLSLKEDEQKSKYAECAADLLNK